MEDCCWLCGNSKGKESLLHILKNELLNGSGNYKFCVFHKPYGSDGFPGGSDGKESACNAGDLASIPGLGRSYGEGNGNPLQYSCLKNPMDRGIWRATVHMVTKSWTRLTTFTFINPMTLLCTEKGDLVTDINQI